MMISWGSTFETRDAQVCECLIPKPVFVSGLRRMNLKDDISGHVGL
jgi:hypothetical protein